MSCRCQWCVLDVPYVPTGVSWTCITCLRRVQGMSSAWPQHIYGMSKISKILPCPTRVRHIHFKGFQGCIFKGEIEASLMGSSPLFIFVFEFFVLFPILLGISSFFNSYICNFSFLAIKHRVMFSYKRDSLSACEGGVVEFPPYRYQLVQCIPSYQPWSQKLYFLSNFKTKHQIDFHSS